MKAIAVRGLMLGLVLLVSAGLVAESRGGSLRDWMTVAEFERCGLGKLSAEELAELSRWIAARPTAPVASTPLRAVAPRVASGVERVALNTESGKYHCRTCQAALRCTASCIEVSLADAERRGIACKLCGGSCR